MKEPCIIAGLFLYVKRKNLFPGYRLAPYSFTNTNVVLRTGNKEPFFVQLYSLCISCISFRFRQTQGRVWIYYL
jgi:hypothetical protein